MGAATSKESVAGVCADRGMESGGLGGEWAGLEGLLTCLDTPGVGVVTGLGDAQG